MRQSSRPIRRRWACLSGVPFSLAPQLAGGRENAGDCLDIGICYTSLGSFINSLRRRHCCRRRMRNTVLRETCFQLSYWTAINGCLCHSVFLFRLECRLLRSVKTRILKLLSGERKRSLLRSLWRLLERRMFKADANLCDRIPPRTDTCPPSSMSASPLHSKGVFER